MNIEKYYSIAGVTYRVFGKSDCMDYDERVLKDFISPKAEACRELELEALDKLSSPQGELVFSDGYIRVYNASGTQIKYIGTVNDELDSAYMRIERKGNCSKAEYIRQKSGDRLVLTAMELEHSLAESKSFILHSSFIAVNGKAILFTAPSGTGKSTQAALWVKHKGAELINGDRCAVAVTDEGVFACGVPFCGSSGVSKNRIYPLAAIVYLKKAEKNIAQRIKGISAFKKVREGCSVDLWNKSDLGTVADLVIKALERVPVLSLECLPDEEAVEVLAKALQGRI